MHRTAGPTIRLFILSLGLALAVALPAMAGYAENHTFSSDELTVRNLIGEIQVTGHGGSAFEVEVTVRGKDASDGIVRVRAEEGSHATLDVVFPSEGRFVYPNLGRGSRTTIRIGDHEDNGWLSNLLGHMFDKNRIEVRSSGTGLEVWADVTIRVPNGATLIVKHGVGQVKAQNVDGDITLATRSGSVDAERIDGRLLVDTGSGHVEIADVNGNLLVDTGSGHVNARNIQAHMSGIRQSNLC